MSFVASMSLSDKASGPATKSGEVGFGCWLFDYFQPSEILKGFGIGHVSGLSGWAMSAFPC